MGEKISSSSAFVSIKLITPAFVVIGTFFSRWQNPRFLLLIGFATMFITSYSMRTLMYCNLVMRLIDEVGVARELHF